MDPVITDPVIKNVYDPDKHDGDLIKAVLKLNSQNLEKDKRIARITDRYEKLWWVCLGIVFLLILLLIVIIAYVTIVKSKLQREPPV